MDNITTIKNTSTRIPLRSTPEQLIFISEMVFREVALQFCNLIIETVFKQHPTELNNILMPIIIIINNAYKFLDSFQLRPDNIKFIIILFNKCFNK